MFYSYDTHMGVDHWLCIMPHLQMSSRKLKQDQSFGMDKLAGHAGLPRHPKGSQQIHSLLLRGCTCAQAEVMIEISRTAWFYPPHSTGKLRTFGWILSTVYYINHSTIYPSLILRSLAFVARGLLLQT